MTFTWITVLMVGLAGFFGAGTVSLWRSEHRFGAGVIAALALVCLAFAIISVIPGPADS
jgi:hypothetical protein